MFCIITEIKHTSYLHELEQKQGKEVLNKAMNDID